MRNVLTFLATFFLYGGLLGSWQAWIFPPLTEPQIGRHGKGGVHVLDAEPPQFYGCRSSPNDGLFYRVEAALSLTSAVRKAGRRRSTGH